MEIRRFDIRWTCQEFDYREDGEYCHASDAMELIAEVKRLKAEIEQWQKLNVVREESQKRTIVALDGMAAMLSDLIKEQYVSLARRWMDKNALRPWDDQGDDVHRDIEED